MKKTRQRYILFEIISNNNIPIEKKELISKIWFSVTAFFGSYHTYQTGLWIIRYDPIHKVGILRCDNISKDMTIAALSFLKSIGDTEIIIHTRKTSGTIRKILEEWRKLFPKVSVPSDERERKK